MTGVELPKFSPVKNRAKAKSFSFKSPDALSYATRLIHQVCCLAGSFDLIERFADEDLCAVVDQHDTAALYDRLIYSLSFQGISDEIAENYMRRHGQATWHAVRKNLAQRPPCPKLKTYWHFYDCRYEKTNDTCAEPDHVAACPVPTHRLRNGHLNQLAYSLYLFIRDVADGDLVGWIDDRLDRANDPGAPDRLGRAQNALIDPLRNVYGVSDKVLTMALSGILIGAAAARPRWLEVGVALIAVDTLVHNFLHRTGILARFNAAHPYGAGCYRQAAAPTSFGRLPIRSMPGSLTAPSRRSFRGSCSTPSGGIAANKVSTFAMATASMTGTGAKTGTASFMAFATEFA